MAKLRHVYRSQVAPGLLLVVALGLNACASLPPRLEPPAINLDAVRIARVTPDEMRLMLTLALDNPNDRDVVLDALDFTLSVGGAVVATAALARPIALRAHGGTQAEIGARTSLRSLSAALDATARERAVSYELAGAVVVNGRTLPFARRGRTSFAEFIGGWR